MKDFKDFQKTHFFCYSYRLYHFLRANNIRYISKGTNQNNNLKYWVFERNEQLGELLGDWEKWKENFSETQVNR